jgi:putative transcriptional regulator
MEFEWDPAKAASNLAKHSVDFPTATKIFDDPDMRFRADLRCVARFAASPAPGAQAVVKGRVTRHRPKHDAPPTDRTDWERLRNMRDEEVEAAALADPDAQPLTEAELAQTFRPADITAMRKRLGLNQSAFARRFQINLRTLQDWEQGRRAPEDAARAYLRVIAHDPDVVAAALED